MKQIHLLFLLLSISYITKAQFGNILDSKDKYKIDYSNPKEYTLAGVNVIGTDFLDHNSLISIVGFKVGQKIKIPGEDISIGLKKLWKQDLLGDIKITVTEIVGDKVYLQIELKERPRLARYSIKGVPNGKAETLGEKVKLIKGRIVTESLIKNTKNSIKKYYAEKGFGNAVIKITQQEDSLFSNSVSLTIFIDKKSKVKIDNIYFEGLGAITEKKARNKLKKTKQKKLIRIFSPSKFIQDEYDEDKEKLIAYYNRLGYRNASIETDTVYAEGEKNVSIKLKIEEGEKFYYRNITWKGNFIYKDAVLERVLGIESGDVYNPENLEKKLSFNPSGADITSLYMNDGYLFFNIEPVEVMIENDSIDIELRMFEGEQATINKVIINGNTKTNDHVIFREVRTVPGEKFRRSDLIRTQRELATLGYFDPEQIDIQPKPNFAVGTVDIEYNLVEKPNDQIELSGGWGGAFRFVGTLGLVFNNFSVKNVTDFSKWKPLPAGDGQRLSVRFQANGKRYQSYSFSLTEPWLGGRKPNSLSISLTKSIQRILNSDETERGSLNLSGITLGLGRRLPWPDNFFAMQNSLGYTIYNLNNYLTTGFETFNNGTGISRSITFNTKLSRNSIDNPTFPRSGSKVTLDAIITPPYSLLGNKGFNGEDIQDRFRWIEYHKWKFNYSWFLKIFGKLVLNARGEFGSIAAYSDEKGLGPFEKFFLGGDGLSQGNFLLGTDIIGLRGYNNNSIVPRDYTGTVTSGGVIYNKYTFELRYALSLNPSATIYLLSFFEGGNNFETFEEFEPFNLKKSVGIGARIFLPAFGLLGIDYGIGFDEIIGAPKANGGQFHFTIGQRL